MLDSSCTELGGQKHYGTTTPSQVEPRKHTAFTLEVWLTNLILMKKGVQKSHVSLIPEGIHNCYRNRNIPSWYRSNTEMAWYYEFLLWKRPASGFHQSNLYRSILQNFSVPLNLHWYSTMKSKKFYVLQEKHVSYLSSDINCTGSIYTGRVTLFLIPIKSHIFMVSWSQSLDRVLMSCWWAFLAIRFSFQPKRNLLTTLNHPFILVYTILHCRFV